MNKTIYFYFFLTAISIVHGDLKAQEASKIVTLKIEKSFEFDRQGQIIINAERGNINIQSWDRDEISVVLTIAVKNTNMELAKQELGYMRYNLVKSRSNVFMNNKMVLPDGGRNGGISSIISARYEIRIPGRADILLHNKFGRVTIKNISGTIHGELQYSDMLLQAYKGDLQMNISVGDLNCLQCDLTGEIRTSHTNVSFNEVSGKQTMHTEYGSFKLAYGEKLIELALTGYATDILIDNEKCHPLDMMFYGSYCPLIISRDCYTPDKKFLRSTYQPALEQTSWSLKYIPPVKSAKLRIDAKFGTISLL